MTMLFEMHPSEKINFENDEVISVLRKGRGPGEVSEIFYKNFTRFSNGNVLLWDAGLNRTTVYNSELEYVADLKGDGIRSKLYHVELVNDSTIVTFSVGDHFLKACRMSDDFRIEKEDLLWQKSVKEIPELSSLANPVMLQTLFFDNYDGVLYIIFEYSSMLVAINENGIEFITNGPDKILNPDPREGSGYSLPTMGKHPEGARDVTVDDNFIYVVFSGKNVSRFEQMRYSFNFDVLIDKIKHSKRLWVFDKDSGVFIKEIELPISARAFKVLGKNAYLLNTIDDEPKVIKYELTEELLSVD